MVPARVDSGEGDFVAAPPPPRPPLAFTHSLHECGVGARNCSRASGARALSEHNTMAPEKFKAVATLDSDELSFVRRLFKNGGEKQVLHGIFHGLIEEINRRYILGLFRRARAPPLSFGHLRT